MMNPHSVPVPLVPSTPLALMIQTFRIHPQTSFPVKKLVSQFFLSVDLVFMVMGRLTYTRISRIPMSIAMWSQVLRGEALVSAKP